MRRQRSRRIASALLLVPALACGAAACQWLTGIESYDAPAQVVDGGTRIVDGGTVQVFVDAADNCVHRYPPAQPATGSSGQNYYFAVAAFDFNSLQVVPDAGPQFDAGGDAADLDAAGDDASASDAAGDDASDGASAPPRDTPAPDGATDAAVPLGLDIDHVCTGFNGSFAVPYESSCAPPSGVAVSSDFPNGVDNNFKQVLTNAQAFVTASQLFTDEQRIVEGRQTLLFEVVDFDPTQSEQSSVGVYVGESEATLPTLSCTPGAPNQTGFAFAPADSGVDASDAYNPSFPRPAFRGCDTWSVSSSSFDDTHLLSQSSRAAYVVGHQLVAHFDQLTIPIGLFGVTMTDAYVIGTIERSADGTFWTITQGTLTGRLPALSVLQNITTVQPPGLAGGYLCPGNPYFEAVHSFLCKNVDLNTDPTAPTTHTCDAISFAASFSAVQIPGFGSTVAPHGSSSPCKPTDVVGCDGDAGTTDASASDGGT